jgi:hypothetical protein
VLYFPQDTFALHSSMASLKLFGIIRGEQKEKAVLLPNATREDRLGESLGSAQDGVHGMWPHYRAAGNPALEL